MVTLGFKWNPRLKLTLIYDKLFFHLATKILTLINKVWPLNCFNFEPLNPREFKGISSRRRLFKFIANRWAWGRCLWKRLVVVPSEMRASSRARRYPRQPRERQPPPGTVTLRNSVETLTNLFTYHGQPRGGGRGRANCRTHALYELEITRPPERVRVI